MPVDCRVISIGTLASHPLWNEPSEARTGHATTSLVVADGANILVDPSLPSQAVLARLSERTAVRPDEITHVFLTSADALHRRGLAAFQGASWLVHEPELEAAKEALTRQVRDAEGGDDELRAWLDNESATLDRCGPAPDSIVRGVDLFPLPGVTPGSCGLLLPLPRATLLIYTWKEILVGNSL